MSPDLLRAYLLGQASPEDCAAIEERLFADDTFEALLAEAEADLLDDWARGRLTPADAALIPQRFPKPKRDLARALLLAAKPRRKPLHPQRWALLAAAALLLLAVALFLRPGPPRVLIAEIRLQQQATRGTNPPLYRMQAGRRIRLSVPKLDDGFLDWKLQIEPGAPIAAEVANGRVFADFDLPDGRHQLLVSASRTSGGLLELVAVYPFELRRDVLQKSPLEK
ncbi:MAG: hypothetical protein JNK87_41645 [Bryobacterales bacterium]|nr:hypothetical protein [Bryobacterales bacterium]